MAPKVSVSNLYKVFGSRPEEALQLLAKGRSKDEILADTGMTVGVQDVSFSVDAGKIFVVMGLSGSGKSTLVRMLNRLIEPTAGEILIDGVDMAHADARLMRKLRLEKITMVFQHFALFPHKTVVDNVAYGLKIRGAPREERHEKALAALDRVGLKAWAEQRPRALSGGMQQRVGLARALAVDAEILLMDEPFSALDPLIRRDMQAELIQLQRELKKTIVFITHDLHEALILGDRIAIMKAGRFVQVGTAQEIVGNPADDYVAAFTQDIDRARVFTGSSVRQDAHALDLARDTPATAMARMQQLDRDALHVLDHGRLAGIVTYRGLAERGGANGAGLTDALIREVPTAPQDAHLYRLYGLCAGGLPVALLDEEGRLAGVVEPQAVFAQMAVAENASGEDVVPPAP